MKKILLILTSFLLLCTLLSCGGESGSSTSTPDSEETGNTDDVDSSGDGSGNQNSDSGENTGSTDSSDTGSGSDNSDSGDGSGDTGNSGSGEGTDDTGSSETGNGDQNSGSEETDEEEPAIEIPVVELNLETIGNGTAGFSCTITGTVAVDHINVSWITYDGDSGSSKITDVTNSSLNGLTNRQFYTFKLTAVSSSGGETEAVEIEAYMPDEEKTIVYVTDVDGLLAIQNDLTAYYRLVNDIDLSGVEWSALGAYDGTAAPTTAFSGVLDGGGYAIKNLSATAATGVYNYSFFDSVENGGVVMNTDFKDFNIVTSYNNTAVTCYLSGSTLYNCNVVEGSIGGSGSSSYKSSGLCLFIKDDPVETDRISRVLNCSNSAEVICPFAETGGLIAANLADGTQVVSCVNSGSIKGFGATGGVVVYNGGDNVVIKGCKNSGTVYGTENGGGTGGIIAYSSGCTFSIINCTNSGSVTVSSLYVGDIAGSLKGDSDEDKYVYVTGCSSSGTVNSLVGSYDDTCIISN